MDDIFVIKFGGNTLADSKNVESLAKELLNLQKKGKNVIVVHGGGSAISAEMKSRGLTPVMILGQRVTDEATMDCVETVLHRINGELVDKFTDAGIRCVGLGAFTFTRQEIRPPVIVTENGEKKEYDLGLIGNVTSVDPNTLLDLLEDNIIPVIYPVGTDGKRKLNINADTMSGGIAAGIGAKELLAVTDVDGILRKYPDPESRIERITIKEIEELTKDGTISEGMIPKVEAAVQAILSGAKAVRMINGTRNRNEITKSLLGEHVGTLIVKE